MPALWLHCSIGQCCMQSSHCNNRRVWCNPLFYEEICEASNWSRPYSTLPLVRRYSQLTQNHGHNARMVASCGLRTRSTDCKSNRPKREHSRITNRRFQSPKSNHAEHVTLMVDNEYYVTRLAVQFASPPQGSATMRFNDGHRAGCREKRIKWRRACVYWRYGSGRPSV